MFRLYGRHRLGWPTILYILDTNTS